MKRIKFWKQFLENLDTNLSTDIMDLNESLSVVEDMVLDEISGGEIDLLDTFNLIDSQVSTENLEILLQDPFFVNSLSSIGLKKSGLQNTDDYQTFLSRSMRFSFVYDISANDLEQPKYILYQIWDSLAESWQSIKLRKVEGDIKKFYDKLSSKTLELSDGTTRWIYYTSNANEWYLQNLDRLDKEFRKVLKKEDLENLIKNKSLLVKII
jgi:hypothetical protein